MIKKCNLSSLVRWPRPNGWLVNAGFSIYQIIGSNFGDIAIPFTR